MKVKIIHIAKATYTVNEDIMAGIVFFIEQRDEEKSKLSR